MDAAIQTALVTDQVIDITTTGRKSGLRRRIEIWFHHVGGRFFITGLPGRRSWYANMCAHPEIIFHLKESVQADLPARVEPITMPDQKREILRPILQNLDRRGDLEKWVAGSPLVEIHFQ